MAVQAVQAVHTAHPTLCGIVIDFRASIIYKENHHALYPLTADRHSASHRHPDRAVRALISKRRRR